jgi:hypothetical protein
LRAIVCHGRTRLPARQIIAQVVAEQHGVVMGAEELAKNSR